jgi:hypothetical protein
MRYKNCLGFGNSKIVNQAINYGYRVGTTFDVLAGYTCPMADVCKTFVVDKKGIKHLEWGENAQFTCYAAQLEAIYKRSYELHKFNTEFTKSDDFVEVLKQQIWFSGTSLHRWNSSGDFYDFSYFMKAYEISKSMPSVYFFAYTKQATFYKWYLENKLPNMDMIYSMGGLQDKYAIKHKLPSCTVITNKKYKFSDVTDEGLPIACQKHNDKYDDLYYIQNQISFGIYVH